MSEHVAIVGGTGDLGRGLAARWAAAGVRVTIGSRDGARAQAAAAELTEQVRPAQPVRGVVNADVGDADVVVLAVPYAGAVDTIAPLAEVLTGRVVVSALNPLGFDRQGPHPLPVTEGSAAQAIAALLPGARVTAALHTVSSRQLGRLEEPLDDDVPVVGDDPAAVEQVVALVGRLDGVRSFPAGPLRLSGALESLVAVLISVNRLHRSHVGLRLSRLADGR